MLRFLYLAKNFEILANSPSTEMDQRTPAWSVALVVLLAKTPLASSTDKFQPIALLAQLKKLYARWVLLFLQADFEEAQIPNQYGFRRGRQAPEVCHTALRLKEKAHEWNQPWCYFKIDVAKAFDSIKHHVVIDALGEICRNNKWQH